jgi:hypothetical protein
MIKINIQRSRSLEPFFNFYVKNSPDVIDPEWKTQILPSDEEISKKIEAYRNIWFKYQDKVLNGICSALDLNFKDNIEVYIVSGSNRSMSNPVVIGSQHSPNKFVVEITHELIHRIFEGTDFKFSKILLNKTDKRIVNNHILVYAILRKIFHDEPEIFKLVVPTIIEDYKMAYNLSESYEEILKFFRDNK